MSFYWLFYSFAWLAAGAYFLWQAKRRGLPAVLAVDAVILSVPLSLVFAHLLSALLDGSVSNLGDFLFTWRGWSGGYLSFGGLLGSTLAFLLAARLHRVGFALTADLAAPAIFLASFLGRVGCFFHGCCFGNTLAHPWALKLWAAIAPQETAPRHPTQLYEAALSLAAFAIVPRLARHFREQPGSGFTALNCLVCYFMIRFVVEFFRIGGSARASVGGLTTAQVISVLGIALCCVWIVRRIRCRRAAPAITIR
jgi:phosphatidylglycerol:prolipoprotein diacylglycerol transferase